MPDRKKVFRFVGSDSGGLIGSRKQPRRACEKCRKRKRRCAHGAPPSPTREHTGSAAAETAPNLTTTALQYGRADEFSASNADGDASFVGNTDPEGAFLIAARPTSTLEDIRQHDLGVWLQLPLDKSRSSILGSPGPLVSSALISHLGEQCLAVLPPDNNMQELLQIYMTNVHPIFPIVDYESYQAMTAGCSEKTLLSQAICIAVSRDRRAKEYLFLRAQPNMSHADISKSLSSAVTTFISLGLVQDKLVLVQALSLTSLFTQFSGDRQEPAELLSRAICHAHTLGLHHKCHSSAGHDETAGTRLFCCLYALDILNSACLGRPVQLHHRDLGRDLSSSIAAQEGPFQLFLRVIQLMDRVIDIYRPHEDSAWKGAFPSFQELLEAIPADMSAVPVHLIATIEVLYHAVAILSCHSTNMHGISRTPSSESQVRQNLSASSVTHIVGEEFRNELSGFPFVPYAVALALRTSYHSVQRSKAPIFEARARRAFISNCRILQELGGDFHSASLMADLGERLIHESGRQKEASAREIQPNEPQGVENASSLGDNVVIYSQPNLDNIERPDLGETSFHETALFDPMSFLGIFDNFEQELEALGTIV